MVESQQKKVLAFCSDEGRLRLRDFFPIFDAVTALRKFLDFSSSLEKIINGTGHRGEREGYGGPRDVTSLSLSLCAGHVEASPILHDAFDATSDRLAPSRSYKCAQKGAHAPLFCKKRPRYAPLVE